MQKLPLVSVIIPIYNTEKERLLECFESIQKQTYRNVEVVIVDDGSRDETAAFLDDYVDGLRSWHVAHEKNGGVSRARNKGLELAAGKYIQFVDGDDALKSEAIELCVDAAEKARADVVAYDLSFYDESLTVLDYDQDYSHLTANISPFSLGDLNASGKFILEQLHPQPYTKLILKDLLVEKKITFPHDIHIAEDHVFSLRLYMEARRMVVIDKPLYKYRASSTGAMSNAYQYSTDVIRAASHMKDLLDNAAILTRWSSGFVDFIISNIAYNQKCFGAHHDAVKELYSAGARLVSTLDKETLRARAASGDGTAIGLLIADEDDGLLDDYIDLMTPRLQRAEQLEREIAEAAAKREASRRGKGVKESSGELINAVGRRIKRGASR